MERGKDWDIELIHPLIFIQAMGFKVPDFVKFNPDAEFQYFRRKQCSHDGTMTFQNDLIAQTLNPITTMDSIYLPSKPKDWSNVARIEYEIGWIHLMSAYGRVDLPAGNYPGMRQRTFMRVRSNVILKDAA